MLNQHFYIHTNLQSHIKQKQNIIYKNNNHIQIHNLINQNFTKHKNTIVKFQFCKKKRI